MKRSALTCVLQQRGNPSNRAELQQIETARIINYSNDGIK